MTEPLHDAEPDDAPHQAVPLDLPTERDIVRIPGSLDTQEQDAYPLVVGDDPAAVSPGAYTVERADGDVRHEVDVGPGKAGEIVID